MTFLVEYFKPKFRKLCNVNYSFTLLPGSISRNQSTMEYVPTLTSENLQFWDKMIGWSPKKSELPFTPTSLH